MERPLEATDRQGSPATRGLMTVGVGDAQSGFGRADVTSGRQCPLSAPGTFRKLSSQCVMSAVEGRAEVVNGAANRRDWPGADLGSHFETGGRLERSRDHARPGEAAGCALR